MIYKNRDIEAVINERGVNLGNIDVVFYTKDINTTSFRLFLKKKIEYANETFYDIFDLRNKRLTPYIDLMMEDGSIFTREPMEIIEADAGLIQYNIPSDILLHIGKVEASVYLLSDENEKDEGVEVAQFYFYIDDNGLTSRVRRVVNTPIVDEAVARVLSQDAQKLLDTRYKTNLENSLRSYLFENADRFKGPKGDEGDKGDVGERGPKGEKGDKGDVPEEITDARGRSNSLKDEMDRIENKTYTKNSNKVRPLVSFYLDDGYQNDYDVVYPKAKSLGIPVTACLYNTSELLSTPDKLKELIDNGWEIHSHTAHHVDLDKMSYEEQKKEMYDNIMHYKNLGIDLKGICYPKGYSNEYTPRAARQYFEVGMSSIPGINSSPIDTYYVKRDLTDQTDMNKMKERVDKILADGKGWLVFYSHTNIFKQNTEVRDRYFEMMEYVKSKEIECVTVHEAMKIYGNTLDIGDVKYSENYLKVGSDGVLDTSNLPIIYNKNLTNVSSIKGTDFKDGKITITSFDLSKKSDIPFDSGVGTLYTDRRFELNEYGQRAFQRFEGIDGTIVQRVYNGGKWSDWSTVGGMNTVRGTFNSASVITDFPKFKRTTFAVLAGDNAGFPEQIGTVETNRFSSADVLGYQLFYPYNRNYFYKRYWTVNGWSDWDKISPTLGLAQSFDFGDIEANSTRTYSFTINGVNDNDVPSINFSQGLANGLIPFIYTAGNNTIVVKIINVYNNKTTIGTRPIRIKVLKN
ncbi:polysaccharide deacetylase family protein [Staphylococcus haemolyticus]|uniref:polysaccharide deacetylase family protein n=1 Tax=Staphylococcus haemolyticus TaxID=1283 RepID=UPI00069F3106|nr:polysaccharide deacetylase family protein [Staphylococcus haemolyticus]RFT94566.1 DUF2479 domain-containing protein [Staphylococcus haemolyticus]RFU01277.1 DUF2479 domain-containing protein [Staphylococcus haemolyticus]